MEIKEKIALYAEAIKKASQAALESDPVEDGGTCNLDSVTINFTGWRQSHIDELSQLANVQISHKLSGFHSGYRFISTPTFGQANRRTTMVEAANKILRSYNIPSSVYYAMD